MVELNYAVYSAKWSKNEIKNHRSHGRITTCSVVVLQIFRQVALGVKVSSNFATNNNIPAMGSISFYPILSQSSTIHLMNIFIPIRKCIFRTKYLFSQHNPSWPGWENDQRILWPLSACFLTLLWPRIIMAKNDKKTFKALQLWFCAEIWNKTCRNRYNNFIFQQQK